MRNVSDKCCRETRNTRFIFNNIFVFENRAIYEIIWKYCVEPDRPRMTIWRMRIAFWIPKATNTHTVCVILIALTLQQWFHESVSKLLDTYIVCLVNIAVGTDRYHVTAWGKLPFPCIRCHSATRTHHINERCVILPCLMIPELQGTLYVSNNSTNKMQQFHKFITWRLCVAQHVSGRFSPTVKAEAPNAVVCSWWRAGRRPKHVEPHINLK